MSLTNAASSLPRKPSGAPASSGGQFTSRIYAPTPTATIPAQGAPFTEEQLRQRDLELAYMNVSNHLTKRVFDARIAVIGDDGSGGMRLVALCNRAGEPVWEAADPHRKEIWANSLTHQIGKVFDPNGNTFMDPEFTDWEGQAVWMLELNQGVKKSLTNNTVFVGFDD